MSIKFVKEIELEDFEAWSGGKTNLDKIKELGILEEAEDYINEAVAFSGEDVTETTINDILWFSMDDLLDDEEEEE